MSVPDVRQSFADPSDPALQQLGLELCVALASNLNASEVVAVLVIAMLRVVEGVLTMETPYPEVNIHSIQGIMKELNERVERCVEHSRAINNRNTAGTIH